MSPLSFILTPLHFFNESVGSYAQCCYLGLGRFDRVQQGLVDTFKLGLACAEEG